MSQNQHHYGLRWPRRGTAYSLGPDFENTARRADATTPEAREQLARTLQAASGLMEQWAKKGIGNIIFYSDEQEAATRSQRLIETIAAAADDPSRIIKTEAFTVHIR